MDDNKKKRIVVSVIVGAVGIAVIAAFVIFSGKSGAPPTAPSGTPSAPGSPGSSLPPGGITQVTFSRSAYDAALSRAVSWQPDAALIKMTLNDPASGAWTFTFISPKNKGKGFAVVADGQGVASTKEIAYSGGGAALPTNIISPDAAMTAARAVPGYANAAIVSLEMIYNASAKQWYWGVKTAKGATVTVKATN